MFGAIRILSLIVILLFIGFSLSAQDYTKAVGVRGVFGFDHYQYAGAEFSFQKDVREIGRTEYNFGWYASNQWDVLKFTGSGNGRWSIKRNSIFMEGSVEVQDT